MMKKSLVLAMVLAGAAASSAWADGARVGVIDVQSIVRHSAQMKALNKRLKDQFSAKHVALEKQQKSLEKAIADFRKNQAVMSTKDKAAAKEKLVKQEQDFNHQQMAFSQAVMSAQQAAMHRMFKQLQDVVKRVAQKEGIDIVFPRNAAFYVDDKLDLTQAAKANFK